MSDANSADPAAAPGSASIRANPPRRRRMIRWLYRIAAAAVGLYILALVLAWAFQERLIFPGSWLSDHLAGPPPAGVEAVWLTMPDGVRVQAWYQAGVGRSAASPGPAMIYFHGNLDLIDTRWNNAEPYVRRGISVLAVEYRGYGQCGGSPGQQAIVADSVRFYDWLAARPEIDRARIGFHGLSVGGGIAVQLARERRPALLVLEATFANMGEMARKHMLPAFLLRNRFDTDAVLPTLNVPVLLLHGDVDELVPLEQARRLESITPGARLVELPGVGHSSWVSDWNAIIGFVCEHFRCE